MGHNSNSYLLDSKSGGNVHHTIPPLHQNTLYKGFWSSGFRLVAGLLYLSFNQNVKETHKAVRCYKGTGNWAYR